MDLKISQNYLAILFVLWLSPVVSSIWGAPVWITISFMCFFAIYLGHEWIHAWICKINNLNVVEINLSTGGNTHILFEQAEGPNKNRIEADVFLAGVAWDSVFYTISTLSAMFFAFHENDKIALVFSISLILILISNLAMPGSDWQEFIKRNNMRV